MTTSALNPALDTREAARSEVRAPHLASSAAWLVGSNLLYSVCQWATVVALAKIGPAHSLGHFGLALAVVTPVVVLSNLSLRSYQATDVHQRYTFAEYMSLRVATNAVAAVVIGVVALVAAATEVLPIIAPLAIAKLAEATSETCYGLAQQRERMRLVAIARAVRGVLGLAALVAVVALGGSLAAGTWALAAAWSGFLLVVELPVVGTLETPFARPDVMRLLHLARECSSLGILNGLIALNQNVPRYLLQAMHGAAAVGYYTALAGVGPALSQLAAAVGHAAAPRLARSASGDPRAFRTLVVRLLGVTALAALVLVLGTALVGRPFLALAYTPDYAAYQPAFVLLVLAAGMWTINTICYFALLAVGHSSLQAVIQSVGLVVTVAAGAGLVPAHGVVGGAAAVTLSGATMACINVWTLHHASKDR